MRERGADIPVVVGGIVPERTCQAAEAGVAGGPHARRHGRPGASSATRSAIARRVAVERVERLTNLLALLLETREPLSLVEIAGELDGQYPEKDSARRAAFERDKAALREIGVPIETEIVGGGPYAGQTRYWIDRDRYELADLDLEPDEMRALQVAVAAVRTGSGSGREALWKLGVDTRHERPARVDRDGARPARAAGAPRGGRRARATVDVRLPR